MTEVKAPVRVLQSGKVYRQMFDAEVQLMKSFSASKSKLQYEKGVTLPEISGKVADFSKSDTTNTVSNATTLLTDRQKTWTTGMPNDSTTENPVLHRQRTADTSFRLQETEADFDIREVRGLPNILHVTKKSSNIIQKIAEKRKERHDKTLEEMHKDLSLISNRVEPRIVSIGENVQRQLKEDDAAIEDLFRPIADDRDLVDFSFDQLEKVWSDVVSRSAVRRQWIASANEWFNQVEDERLEAISSVLKSYTTKLEKISSLPNADIHRLIENEAMMINQSALANRRAFAKLNTNLLESDIAREVTQHRNWNERLKDWRKLNAEMAVKQFSEFMEGEEITNSPGIQVILEGYLAEQKELSDKRLSIMEQLREFKPPTSTKQAVHEWNSGLMKANENVDKLHVKMVQSLHQKYEATCQTCLTEIEKYKQNLLISKVCDEEDMRRIVNEYFLPQVGNRLKSFEKKLEEMDVQLEEQAINSGKLLKSLFIFTRGAAHLWDVHEVGMAKQERTLQEELEQSRQSHDADNQDREMKLDVALDKLRQESTDEALASSFDQCMALLNHIKEGYEEFHVQQLQKVSEYPGMVEGELRRYAETVGGYFSVDKDNPADKEPVAAEEEEEESPRQKKRKKPASGGKVTPKPRKQSSQTETKSKQKLRSQSSHSDDIIGRSSRSKVAEEMLKRHLSQQLDAEQIKSIKPKHSKGKRKSKKIEEESRAEIPRVVQEVITTNRGTTYYVMSVADTDEEDDSLDAKKDSSSEDPTFMTDFEKTSYLYQMPEHVKNIYIDPAYVKEMKAHIRMLFLNHLEDWEEESMRTAEILTKDKSEELASELDLRLHLHAPRSRRIEMDVRNVRAAELVLHKERVNRHCRGINAALDSLKHDFAQMTRHHDDEAVEFRFSVEKMEEVYSNATKCTKMKELTDNLHMDLANYVQNVKISLRSFRRTLDNTLGRLRESNAQCVRSFKLFCEGGNFSPEETIPLRKKLEKIAQKVDHSEGTVMRDLEGMESKRIEQAADHVTKFEEKFRNHLMDMTFVEAMRRWATNSQVRIKTEVEHSNGMAARTAGHLATLRRRVDACERPNIDKESVSPDLLHSYMPEVMEFLHERASYLHCHLPDVAMQQVITSNSQMQLDSDAINPDTSQETTASSAGMHRPSSSRRVITREDKSRQGLDTQGSVGRGRNLSEDAAIGLIKNILRAQTGRNVVDFDDVRSTATGTSRAPVSTSNSNSGFVTRQQRTLQRQTTLASIAGSSVDAEPPKRTNVDGVVSVIYKRRETKFDPKYMLFGAKPVDGDFFMAKVYQILYETLDGMLSTAEIYYKQKGPRMPTRPQHIQDSFDACAEAVGEKLSSFEKQAEEFHNTSLQQFRQILRDLEHELCGVSRLVLNDLLQKEIDALQQDQDGIKEQFRDAEGDWEQEKYSNKNALRTTMGHPDQKPDLLRLSEVESKRQTDHVTGIHEHSSQLESNVRTRASRFANRLAATANQLLKEFDALLTIDDVIVGRVPPRKEPASVLMRRRADGYDMADVADPSFGETALVERGANAWPPCNFDLLKLSKEEEDAIHLEFREPFKTERTTLPHVKTSTRRDEVLRHYRSAHMKALESIRISQSERLQKEERWKKNWCDCLSNVKKLYR